MEDGKFEGVARPGDELLQVDFADGADGVELESVNIFVLIECMYGKGPHICAAGVIFGQVSAKAV